MALPSAPQFPPPETAWPLLRADAVAPESSPGPADWSAAAGPDNLDEQQAAVNNASTQNAAAPIPPPAPACCPPPPTHPPAAPAGSGSTARARADGLLICVPAR